MTEGFVEHANGRRTWYRVAGEPSERPPLLVLHGGPGGCTGNDMLAVERIAEDREVYEYDQLDVGRSSRVGDPSEWTVDGHLAELALLRERLGLHEVHLVGLSWGGMLALSHLFDGATGIASVTLTGAPYTVPRWLETAARHRAALPTPNRRALERCERTLLRSTPKRVRPGPGKKDAALRMQAAVMAAALPLLLTRPAQAMARAASFVPPLRHAAYQVVGLEMMKRHQFRGGVVPAGALVGMAGMNRSVYETMWGPSEFVAWGPLKDFDLTDRLHEIDVPLLVTSGAHEFAAPDQVRELLERVPHAQWELFEDGAHAGPYEEPERYATVLREFLLKADSVR
jgi:L-proline amide hydrolase